MDMFRPRSVQTGGPRGRGRRGTLLSDASVSVHWRVLKVFVLEDSLHAIKSLLASKAEIIIHEGCLDGGVGSYIYIRRSDHALKILSPLAEHGFCEDRLYAHRGQVIRIKYSATAA